MKQTGTKQEVFTGFGTLKLVVSQKVRSESEEAAYVELLTQLNSLNININKISFETDNGTIHTLKVHDHDLDWETVYGENE